MNVARAAYGLTLILIGCGGTGRDAMKPVVAPVGVERRASIDGSERVALAPASTRVSTTIVSASFATSVEELFVEGQTHLRQGRPAQAASLFDRVVASEPEGPLAQRALFQGALAHDAAGARHDAALRFEQVTQRFPDGPWAREATLRALRVRMHLEQWERAAQLAVDLQQRGPDDSPLARIVSHAARALGAIASGQVDAAQRHVGAGLSLVERLGLDRAGRLPRDLGILYLASGETYRLRAEGETLAGDLGGFSARLERRCELLLLAQSAYSNVMRAHDAHWSTIAGYRVGELYEGLHRELMALPMQRAGTSREQLLFEGAMRLRYSVLLAKGESMLDHTLAMAARTGERSEWVQRTQAARVALASARRDEQEALSRLPFTREELQRAMDELGARRSGPGGGARPGGDP